MTKLEFPILGTTTPAMLGRTSLMNRVIAALSKTIPDHIQIVGPRFSGKTVFLNELVHRLSKAGSPYSKVLFWDLGHNTPLTDSQFIYDLAMKLADAMEDGHQECSDFLRDSQTLSYKDIEEVLEIIGSSGEKVLLVLDGFDKPLSSGKLTRNLWDQLREIALIKSLRLVTASRRTLRDLIRDPESQTSDFWNIFDPSPIRIGCFDEDDLNAIIQSIDQFEFSSGAISELKNSANGNPILTLSALNHLREIETGDSVTDKDMQKACTEAFNYVESHLDTWWDECSSSTKDLVRRVLEEKSIPSKGVAVSDADMAIQLGFIRREGSNFGYGNRFLSRWLGEMSNETNALSRLFGEKEQYKVNFRGILERRANQINGIDQDLGRYIELCLQELPLYPKICCSHIRGILDRSLELIWQAELGERKIPEGWFDVWNRNGEKRIEEWKTRFPVGGQRLRLLDLMTGSLNSSPCAKYVDKGTYTLANSINGFGDLGQHQEGVVIDTNIAYAAVHLCIELAAKLAEQLSDE